MKSSDIEKKACQQGRMKGDDSKVGSISGGYDMIDAIKKQRLNINIDTKPEDIEYAKSIH